jgi:hypothetical protein
MCSVKDFDAQGCKASGGVAIGKLQPGVLYPYALWNVDELFLRNKD